MAADESAGEASATTTTAETPTYDTVEAAVRGQLSKALGGRRGIIEAAVPTIVFTLSWISSENLRLSLILSISTAVVLLLVRVVQRSNPQFVLNSLIGIAIGAFFATRSGEAKDVFLPGILYNAGYAAMMLLTIAIRWPLVGFLIGSISGDPPAGGATRGSSNCVPG